MTSYIGFDLETTGVDTKTDKPVQISLIQANDSGFTRILINTLCNPMMPIHPEAQKVHGISNEMVKNHPDYAIALWNTDLLAETVRTDEVLITMNGKSFDVPMASNCLGAPAFANFPHFDVYQAACRYFPDLKQRRLGALHQHFFNESLQGAHDATVDVLASIRIATEMSKQTGLRIEEMIEDLNVPKPYSIMPFGKYAGWMLDDLPKSWAKFMAKQGNMSEDLKATVDYVLGV